MLHKGIEFFCSNLWFSYPYIFATGCRRPLIFQTLNAVRSNTLILKYQRSRPSCKENYGKVKWSPEKLKNYKKTLYIIYTTLLVCWYPINAKTENPIGPKYSVGPNVTPGKVDGLSKFPKFASNKIRFSLNLKIHKFCIKNLRIFCCFSFTMYTKRKCSQLKKKPSI